MNAEGKSDVNITDNLVKLDGNTSILNRAIVVHEGYLMYCEKGYTDN